MISFLRPVALSLLFSFSTLADPIWVPVDDGTWVRAPPRIVLDGQVTELFNLFNFNDHGFLPWKGGGFVSASQGADGWAYGAWIDGPLNPYRVNGDTYFQLPHSENYRIRVPGNDWGNRQSWTIEGTPAAWSWYWTWWGVVPGLQVLPAQRNQLESAYNNKNWMFSVYNSSNTLYALTHHEWYREQSVADGVPGFRTELPDGGNQPIFSIGWATSNDLGSTWTMVDTAAGTDRVITPPEPSDWTPVQDGFGYAHPSNIVKEGDYYYVFATARNRSRTGSPTPSLGVSLFRTSNLATPLGWQFWNGTDWSVISHGTYLGNFGPQMPHVFWVDQVGTGELFAQNVRRHKNGRWITLGPKYYLDCLARTDDGGCANYKYQAVFSWTASLASPAELDSHLTNVEQNELSLFGGDGGSNVYYSFFDVDGSADDNYQSVGDHPLLVVPWVYNSPAGFHGYYHQFLTLIGF